ncbi:hypothetical protein H8E77_07865 [bacterium]|nr:hypothetical protein [bacterium]
MSQLGQESFPSAGNTKRFKITWSEFVQHVLVLTIKAYQAMYQDQIAQSNWEENTFTIRLGEDYLRPIAFNNEYSVRVEIRTKVHTQQMREGKQATIEAKEMDLSLYGIWEQDYHKIRFVWEAKRVGDKRVNDKYRKLNYEYIHGGIYRFIRREYADCLSDAGMLGYVLAGSVANIVGDINLSMGRIRKNPPLSESNHLRLAQPIDNCQVPLLNHRFRGNSSPPDSKNQKGTPCQKTVENVYRSHHTRTDDTKICIHHLFLKFEFNF